MTRTVSRTVLTRDASTPRELLDVSSTTAPLKVLCVLVFLCVCVCVCACVRDCEGYGRMRLNEDELFVA